MTLMLHMQVLRVVRRQFREALGAQVSSWDQLDMWLSELPYSAVAALWEKERVSADQHTLFGVPAVQALREARQTDLRQLVRQHRMATLRAGARFRKVHLHRAQQVGPGWVDPLPASFDETEGVILLLNC